MAAELYDIAFDGYALDGDIDGADLRTTQRDITARVAVEGPLLIVTAVHVRDYR